MAEEAILVEAIAAGAEAAANNAARQTLATADKLGLLHIIPA
jgi:hypothetical protein